MTNSWAVRLLLSALVSLLVAAFSFAQGGAAGSISGTVHDEQGLPLAGASVVLRSANPPLRREVQTDPEGQFSITGMQAAQYHLLLLRGGEILWSFPVTLATGQGTLRVDIDLKKLRDEVASRTRLEPGLERRLTAEREQAERTFVLHAHFNRAMRLSEDGKLEDAVQEYRAALELEPNSGTILGLVGSALTELGRYEEARGALERALEREPTEAAHHSNLGALLAREGKPEEALAHFRRAAQLDPERAASYHFNAGALLLNVGRFEEAIAALQEVTRLEPTLAAAHFFLAVGMLRQAEARFGRGLLERPIERTNIINVFQRYLQLEPDGPYASQARDYLEHLGSAPPAILLPPVPQPEDLP
jgi:Tfp pilus assembly protein PilF